MKQDFRLTSTLSLIFSPNTNWMLPVMAVLVCERFLKKKVIPGFGLTVYLNHPASYFGSIIKFCLLLEKEMLWGKSNLHILNFCKM